jgi:hypothetical protein
MLAMKNIKQKMPKKSALLFILCVLTLYWRHPHLDHHSKQPAPATTHEPPKPVIHRKKPQKTLTLSQEIENLMRLKPSNMTIELLDISANLIKLSGQIETTNTKAANRFLTAIKHDIPDIKNYRWQLKPDKQALAHMDLLIKLKSNNFKKYKNPKNPNNLKKPPIHTLLGQFQSLNPKMGLLIQEHSLTHACHLTLWSSYAYALNLMKYIEKNSGNLCISVKLKKLGLAPYVEMNLLCENSC